MFKISQGSKLVVASVHTVSNTSPPSYGAMLKMFTNPTPHLAPFVEKFSLLLTKCKLIKLIIIRIRPYHLNSN